MNINILSQKNLFTKISTIVSLGLILSLFLNNIPVHASDLSQEGTLLQKCDNVEEALLQDELNRITQDVFAQAMDKIQLDKIVADQWQEVGMDVVLDGEVDRAVTRIQNEKELWDKFLSGWSAAKAEELAQEVADQAFGSIAFRDKIDNLSNAIASDISVKIAELSADSTSNALSCLQTFIRGNYADVIVTEFEKTVQSDAESLSALVDEEVEFGILSIIGEHQAALGGVGVIIAAQITKVIVQRIGQAIAKRVAGRLVGRVVGRLGSTVIPIAGWAVGAGLIAYDVYEGRDGALPQIQEALKSEEIKDVIRNEIVVSIEPELRREMPTIAREIADSLNNEWDEVRRRIRQVLELAEENEQFATILNDLNEEELPKLVKLTDIALPMLTREGVYASLADGTFAQVLSYRESAYEILKTEKSMQDVISWGELAGDDMIDAVVEYEIYKHQIPDELDREQLERLVLVNDKAIISKLALLESSTIDNLLLSVSSETFRTLSEQLSDDDLKWLAAYLPEMEPPQQNQLVSRLIAEPEVMAHLKSENVKESLVAAPHIDEAISFLNGASDYRTLGFDLFNKAIGTSSIPWNLFFVKYSVVTLAVFALAAVVILLILFRLLFRRRTVTIVNKMPD